MHLFLSPHFDDAVLSCGGTIHQLVNAGQRVTVRTVMGGSPSPNRMPDTPIIRDLHKRWAAGNDPVATRIKEDEAAITSLGARASRLLYWMDCVYRVSRSGEPLYSTEESLFGDIHPDDVAGKLLQTLVFPPGERVQVLYAPIGVGNHVDHQIVRNWALELKNQYHEVALKFYEEYPYSQKDDAVSHAMEYFSTLESPKQLEACPNPVSDGDMDAKIAAIRHHQSQISTFWENDADMDADVRATMKRAGSDEPAELFWCIS